MIVLDASVVIAHLDREDALHQRATELLSAHVGEEFVVSALTLAEVLVRPARAGVLQQAEHAVARLSVRVAPIGAASSAPLARLRAETNLRMPDCCVLLEAEQSAAGLATFDARLAAVAVARGDRLID